jgi:hypothetical protein
VKLLQYYDDPCIIYSIYWSQHNHAKYFIVQFYDSPRHRTFSYTFIILKLLLVTLLAKHPNMQGFVTAEMHAPVATFHSLIACHTVQQLQAGFLNSHWKNSSYRHTAHRKSSHSLISIVDLHVIKIHFSVPILVYYFCCLFPSSRLDLIANPLRGWQISLYLSLFFLEFSFSALCYTLASISTLN